MRSAESDHIPNKLSPEEEESTNGVAEFSIGGGSDDAFFKIVVDLVVMLLFDFDFELIGVWDAEIVVDEALLIKKA